MRASTADGRDGGTRIEGASWDLGQTLRNADREQSRGRRAGASRCFRDSRSDLSHTEPYEHATISTTRARARGEALVTLRRSPDHLAERGTSQRRPSAHDAMPIRGYYDALGPLPTPPLALLAQQRLSTGCLPVPLRRSTSSARSTTAP